MDSAINKPRVAVTLGDVAGVGPEIVIRAWSEPRVHDRCRPVVVGHPQIVRRAIERFGGQSGRPELVQVTAVDEVEPSMALIPCLAVGSDEVADVPAGRVDRRGGQAAYDAVVAATQLALDGRVDAITTGPISKEAFWKAGHHVPGHTELLAQLCGVDRYAMMLYLAAGQGVCGAHGLGVVHVTLHLSVRDALDQVTTDAVLSKCRLADGALRLFGAEKPRVGVCALNPHAGEQGGFGDEEQRFIGPAVERGRGEGLQLSGPLPADTLMVRARNGDFDAVVAMLHDQGHIALKLLGMHRAVNVTLGLPIVRTSVAHGTAMDIAWQGGAESSGMVAALSVASQLARAAAGSGTAASWPCGSKSPTT